MRQIAVLRGKTTSHPCIHVVLEVNLVKLDCNNDDDRFEPNATSKEITFGIYKYFKLQNYAINDQFYCRRRTSFHDPIINHHNSHPDIILHGPIRKKELS